MRRHEPIANLSGSTPATGLASPLAADLDRRKFVAGAVAAAGWSANIFCAPVEAAVEPTVVLINEPHLRQKFPAEAASLIAGAKAFAERQGGALIDVSRQPAARAIKAQLAKLRPRPKQIVIVGDEGGVPRFPVKAPEVDIQIDSFYGDLDGDGLTEIAVTRVLGSPRAMTRQLGQSVAFGGSPHAVVLAADPRMHLENNRFVSLIGDLGCTMELSEPGNPRLLANADVIALMGHGNPDGWYSDRPYVTTATVPDLPRQPVIYAGGCSTTVPGAPILQKFMEKGCRAYIGAVSDGYGWTPGFLGNELMFHLMDAIAAYPDWTVARLICEARNRFIRANNMQSLVLRLERGESPQVDMVDVHSALQMQMFGDINARFPKTPPHPPHRNVALAARRLKGNESASIRYDVGNADGLPTLFLQAAWDKDVSSSLQMEVAQNGALLHKLDWREQREFWAYRDFSVGGYWDGGRYHAFALVPLVRRQGSNEVAVRVTHISKPVELLAGSALQVWPARPPSSPPSQLARQTGKNLLWLTRDEESGPLRGALSAIGGLRFDRRYDLGNVHAPYEFPDRADQLIDPTRYDVILLDNLDNGCRKIPRGMDARLRDFVRQGGGLIMTGGPWGFSGKEGYKGGGQGGYGGTPIEEALPVRISGDTDCINRKTAVRLVNAKHPIADGLDWSSVPPIHGYNRVTARAEAAVVARTDTGDPFVAAWQFGKGRAVAVTTRTAGDWGADFKQWGQYRRFWENVVRFAGAMAAQPIDLTGVWRANDNGAYTIRQSGSQITWEGVSGDGGKRWTHTFNGTLQGSTITGQWTDHPPGALRNSGALAIRVAHRARLEKAPGSSPIFGGSIWVRDLSGVWRANDGGTYTIKHSGLQIAWEAVSGDGGKSWANSFEGTLGQGDAIVGHWRDHRTNGNGDLSLLVIDPQRMEKVPGAGRGFGGSVWTR